MKSAYKIKRKKNKFNKIVIILVLIGIMITMSTAYSLLSTELTIVGNVTGEKTDPPLEVVVPDPTTDKNGVTRFTSNTDFTYTFWGNTTTIFKVVSETYENNTITTTLKYVYNQWLSTSYVNGTITLSLENGTSSTFSNGKMEIEEVYDPNTNKAFQSNTYNVGSTTLQPGETGTPSVTLSLAGKNITDGTMCKYKITYEVDGVQKVFYYILILQPYS